MTDQPVRLLVDPPEAPRDRLVALLRPLLIIPHALVVGGPFVGLGAGGLRTGALGVLALTIALLDWFAILVTGRPLAGLQGLKRLYLGWRARVLVYASFLRDEYPPFGEGSYPAALELPADPPVRDRFVVALRPLLLIPHLVVLMGLLVAAVATTLWAWLSLSIRGRLSARVWRFNRDVMAYVLRVEAYALLVHDQLPPFALAVPSDAAGVAPVAAEH
jgi:hypothetical protein